MEKEVSKKTGAILLLSAILVAILITFSILNYTQTLKVVEGPSESDSSGAITLTFNKPLKVKDESAGSVSLEVLPSESE
ncbi:hypothetical protein CMO87_01540 [Candidatus Woesearchaeota archaeon]|jgi:hypothetical protein|nr:hypothetical protein [Candidatus Woesearchaeota archaeon]|tara:strand:- start:2256 stop:2492 length:237 start_codon:yes stop_codon:yes gene_type:complete